VILAYSGGIMRPPGWSDIVIDLAGLELSATVPLLGDHENKLSSVVGSGVPKIVGGQLHISGTLARGTAAADNVIRLAKSGVQLGASVGVGPTATQNLKSGETVTVNGQTFTAGEDGLTIIKRGILKEVSIVPLGADRLAGVTNIAAKSGAHKMPKTATFEEYMVEYKVEPNNLTAHQLAGIHAGYCGRSCYEPTDADHLAVAPMILASGPADPAVAEQRRLKMIEAACTGEFTVDGLDEQVQALQASAITGEITVDSLIQKMRPIHLSQIVDSRPKGPGIRSGSSNMITAKSIEAALLMRAGKSALAEKQYDEQTLHAAERHRHTSLVDIAAACCRIDGREVQGMSRPEIIRAAFSTVSLPTTLSNVMGKTLWDAYSENTLNWRGFARILSSADFKPQVGIRPSFSGSLEEVGEGGEIKHGSLKEATFPWSIGTFAKQIKITRQMLINDDLSFLNETAPLMGKMASRAVNDLVWKTVMANAGSFFASGNDNLLEASSTLGTTSLASAVAKMRSQTDDEGNSIDMAPAVLCVPPELEFVARGLLESTEISAAIDAGDSHSTPTGNALRGIAALAVESRLSNENFTGYSAAAWYLFASAMNSPIVVGFLDGRETPTIEFFGMDSDINTLGVAWRVFHDFGVATADHRAAVKATGAGA